MNVNVIVKGDALVLLRTTIVKGNKRDKRQRREGRTYTNITRLNDPNNNQETGIARENLKHKEHPRLHF